MAIPDAQRVFQEAIEDALEAYMRATQVDESSILADWVVGYTRQMIDDEDDVVYANSLITKAGTNPNGHAGLAAWTADVIAASALETVEDDDD